MGSTPERPVSRTALARCGMACVAVLTLVLGQAGCNDEPQADYTAASVITEHGFARDGAALRKRSGEVFKLWGFVDQQNLYGDARVRELLGDWWSGDGPDPATWRFNLKARENDGPGRSFAVLVPNDGRREFVLKRFRRDAVAHQPTKVRVTGKLFTFEAPGNFRSRVGMFLELESSGDLLFESAYAP